MGRGAAAALVLLLLTGCQVRSEVAVHAAPDGSGRVVVTVSLDRSAATRMAGTQPATDDLVRAGWKVERPQRLRDGGIVYRAEKRFKSPDEAGRLLVEVGGTAGPLRGFALDREHTFLKTRTHLRGTLDLRAGAAAFGDARLTQQLNGRPLGVDPSRVAPLDRAVRLEVTAVLPGRTTHWRARVGQRVVVAASAERWNATSIVFAAVAGLALVVFAASLRRALRGPRVRGPVTPPS